MKPQRFEIDEPDLKPITNCINGKIEITPEICKKFWDYRADSGHLWHLLFDLVGEDFVTTRRQDESIRKVLEEWDAHSNAAGLDKMLDEKLASRYKAILLRCKDTIEDTRRKYVIAPKTCDGCSAYDLCKELRTTPALEESNNIELIYKNEDFVGGKGMIEIGKEKLTCLRLQKWNTIIIPRLKRQGRLGELRTPAPQMTVSRDEYVYY